MRCDNCHKRRKTYAVLVDESEYQYWCKQCLRDSEDPYAADYPQADIPDEERSAVSDNQKPAP